MLALSTARCQVLGMMALHDSHTREEPLFAELSLLQPALPAQQETLKQNSLARTGLAGPEP